MISGIRIFKCIDRAVQKYFHVESRRSSIRLQVAAKFAVTDDLFFRHVDYGWLSIAPHRRQVIPCRMAAPVIVPIL